MGRATGVWSGGVWVSVLDVGSGVVLEGWWGVRRWVPGLEVEVVVLGLVEAVLVELLWQLFAVLLPVHPVALFRPFAQRCARL